MYVCMYVCIYITYIAEDNYSETRLLLYVHEQFTMSLHLCVPLLYVYGY